jgi:hypothetical protein
MSFQMRLHSPIKPTPMPPEIPQGDLPVDPDADDPDADLPSFGRLPKIKPPKDHPVNGP